MNKKSIIFNEFIKEKNMNCFEKKEMNDEFDTIIFSSHLEVDNEKLPVIIINDVSIYTVIRVKILNQIDLKGKKKLLIKINQLNSEYKAFKYYFKDNGLFLDICTPCDKNSYNSEIIYTLLNVLLKHLIKEYKNLTKYKK